MNNHTKGPWRALESPAAPGFWHIEHTDADGKRIGDVGYLTLNQSQVAANARLIAAAPDLLAVALHCEALLTRYEINRADGEAIEDEALALIRAALAKAGATQ